MAGIVRNLDQPSGYSGAGVVAQASRHTTRTSGLDENRPAVLLLLRKFLVQPIGATRPPNQSGDFQHPAWWESLVLYIAATTTLWHHGIEPEVIAATITSTATEKVDAATTPSAVRFTYWGRTLRTWRRPPTGHLAELLRVTAPRVERGSSAAVGAPRGF